MRRSIIAVLTLAALGAAAAPASAETLTVTSPLDNGSAGTLRWAIVKSNASTGVADTIRFSLAASAPHTITPQSNLPTITDPVEIDGGAKPTVTLDATNTTRALALATNGSVVRGLHIMESSSAGIADGIRVTGDGNRIETSYIGTNRSGVSTQNWNLAVGVAIAGDGNVVTGSVIAEIDGNGIVAVGDENRIEGNRIGLDLDPGSQLGNHQHGVKLVGDRNVVGGTRNEIGDNSFDGVRVEGDENVVEGNHVGLADGNGDDGVAIRGDGNVVGPDNVISHNHNGVGLDDLSDENQIVGNLIGTDALGTTALGNWTGIDLNDASRNSVEDNVISGNDFDGILIEGTERAEDNVITGNAIGTDERGTLDLGNGGSGVSIEWSLENSVGTASGPANTIAYNGDDGVSVVGSEATRNTILRNSIFANGDLPIDLNDDGVTPNDGAPDADGGANERQNTHHRQRLHGFNVIDQVVTMTTHVRWELESVPSSTFRIELFAGTQCGEARSYLGSVNATTDAAGHAEGTTETDIATVLPGTVTGTATQLNSILPIRPIEIELFLSTSELSAC